MNATMKAYQAMNKAAADVAAGKTGAKTRLAAAKKRYVALVTASAKKDAEERVKKAKKNADAVGKKKRVAVAKKKTTTTAKKKTTAKRRTASKARR